MNKIKKFLILFLPYFVLLLMIGARDNSVKAMTFDQLEIYVELNQDGSASIREDWHLTVDEGDDQTELYKPIDLHESQELVDYQAFMNGVEFTFQEDWEVEATREEKAGYYGFNNQSELNIGITTDGVNTYTFNYTLTNFVLDVNDAQMIYWMFINQEMDPAPNQASAVIQVDHPSLTKDQIKIWGFGFQGDVYFENEQMVWKTSKPMTPDHYMVSLVRFPPATFSTNAQVEGDFEDWQNRAFEGSDYETSIWPLGLILILAGVGGLVCIIIGIRVYQNQRYGLSGLTFSQRRKGLKLSKKYYPRTNDLHRRFKEEYYRDIISTNVYQLAEFVYRMLRSRTDCLNNYLMATILYLVMTESIDLDGEGKSTVITFYDLDERLPEAARALYRILKEQAEGDSVTFSTLVKKISYSKLKQWDKNNRMQSRIYLKEQGLATDPTSFNSNDSETERILKQIEQNIGIRYTRSGHELRDKLYQYIAFLKDFTLVDERQSIEVRVYNFMMIYAALFNEVDAVEKELSALKVNQDQPLDKRSGRPVVVLYPQTVRSARAVQGMLHSSSKGSPGQASGGGGGPASLGGGGGSFGGGVGGGAR